MLLTGLARVRTVLQEMNMKEAKFEDLLTNELNDLYDAERQIIDALPKMKEAASTEELADAFEQHLEQTREQVKRLDRIFSQMGEQPTGKQCEGMEGLLREGEKLMSEMEKSPVLDAALIGAAQKVEHYEISGYGTARTMASMLGQSEVAELLQETLDEEKDTDETLTEIAEAVMGGDAVDSDEELDEEEIEVEDK
jgi:ferritin-like metal-binding protein YciE